MKLPGVAGPGLEMLAAGPEVAAGGTLVGQRQLTGNRNQRPRGLVRTRQGNRPEQPLGIGVPHLVEDLFDRAGFHRFAGIHHRDAVAGLQDQAQVVRHEDHGGAEFLGQLLDQLDDARLHRHVERGGRLVEQQQRRFGQQAHRDNHPLLLTAGELMRIGSEQTLRVGQFHRLEYVERHIRRFGLGLALVEDRDLHQLRADLHRRIQ